MTLQRLTRSEAAAAVSGTSLRAKPLVTSDRVRSLTPRDRRERREERATPPEISGTFETLLGELTRILATGFDYTARLQDLTAIVAERLDCGCVVDLLEPAGHVQLATVSERAAVISSECLAPLVADVVTRRRTAAADLDPPVATLRGGSRRARPVAERALHDTGLPWIVCAPIAAEDGQALGALTIFGGAAGGYAPRQLAREIGRRAAGAIHNGRLYASALHAAKERQRVLSLVAHELKNPLGVILMGTVQALEGNGADGPPTQRRELEAIHRSAKRMKKLVGDLLDLASIDAGKLSVKPSACDLPSVIAEAIADVAPNAAAAAVAIEDEHASCLPLAWADADRLGQVLVNLASNAIKFTPRGGVVRIRCAAVDDSEIVVAVEDTGRGIAPGDLHRIFDHFWQAADTAELGSGLGLAICKSIIELSGGRIWAQSTVAVGTTVYFTVPTRPSS